MKAEYKIYQDIKSKEIFIALNKKHLSLSFPGRFSRPRLFDLVNCIGYVDLKNFHLILFDDSVKEKVIRDVHDTIKDMGRNLIENIADIEL